MTRPITADCWFLSGPTASGKSEVGIELARRIGAEIISMDSMAIYRRMDIGTAKPSAAQRCAVPHHLVDVLEPHEEYSLAQYIAAAEQTVREIRSRGHESLFVGGTPLYLKGLLRGIFQGPPANDEFRRRCEEEARRGPPGLLHQRLAEIDAEAARRLHPNDTRRIIRAMEVHAETQQPISSLQRQFALGCPADACRVFVLQWPKEELDVRINRRVEQMFADGLVDEVQTLLADGQPLSKTASQAVGYREVIELLQSDGDRQETMALIQTHTRQFAKRQGTWFRSLTECRFVACSATMLTDEIVDQIVTIGSGSKSPPCQ